MPKDQVDALGWFVSGVHFVDRQNEMTPDRSFVNTTRNLLTEGAHHRISINRYNCIKQAVIKQSRALVH